MSTDKKRIQDLEDQTRDLELMFGGHLRTLYIIYKDFERRIKRLEELAEEAKE